MTPYINHTCSDRFHPLNISLSYGPVSQAAYLDVLAHYGAWLDKGMPYTLLNIRDEASFEPSLGLGKVAKTWMKQYLSLLKKYEQGIALVVPETKYEQVCRVNFEAISAGACQVFTQTAAALDWLASGELEALRGFDNWESVGLFLQGFPQIHSDQTLHYSGI